MAGVGKIEKSIVDNKQRLLTEDKSKIGSKKVTFDMPEEKNIMEKVKVEVNEEIRKNCTEVRKEMRDLVEREVIRIRRDIQEDVDKEIRKFEEKLEEVMKELETVKKDLSENNRKMVESLKDIRSLGKTSSEGNDYDNEGRSVSNFGKQGDNSRVGSKVSEEGLSREVNVLKKLISDSEKEERKKI